MVENESHYIFQVNKAFGVYLFYLLILELAIFNQGEQVFSSQVFYFNIKFFGYINIY